SPTTSRSTRRSATTPLACGPTRSKKRAAARRRAPRSNNSRATIRTRSARATPRFTPRNCSRWKAKPRQSPPKSNGSPTPTTRTPQAQLQRGVAAFNARRAADTIGALSAVPVSAGETRAEALNYLAQSYARARQWDAARSTLDEMRRVFPVSVWTMRALAAAAQTARDDKDQSDALFFDRLAVQQFRSEE